MQLTANGIVPLRASFRLFNGFPVVNWYWKLLKAVSWPSIIITVLANTVIIIGSTAILIIIDVRHHDFNGFPVVNWYQKPLKAENGRQIILKMAALQLAKNFRNAKQFSTDFVKGTIAILITIEGRFQVFFNGFSVVNWY
jgi:hypothetical protein